MMLMASRPSIICINVFVFHPNFFYNPSKFVYCKGACPDEARFLILRLWAVKIWKTPYFHVVAVKIHKIFCFSTDFPIKKRKKRENSCIIVYNSCVAKISYIADRKRCGKSYAARVYYKCIYIWCWWCGQDHLPLFCINFFVSQPIFFNDPSKFVYCKDACSDEARILILGLGAVKSKITLFFMFYS